MTICIAATCNLFDELKIVLCSDWQTSSPLGSADTVLKQHGLGNGWYCLTSGYSSEIDALRILFKNAFITARNIDETNIAALARTPLQIRKKEKIEEYITGRFGISYNDFLKFGRDKLPEGIFRDSVVEISKMSLRADFILAGFINESPMLIETDKDGGVHIKEYFTAIGEGALLATAALLQRGHSDTNTLNNTIYCVYEAKRYAEKVPTVGKYTTIAIVGTDGKRTSISNEGLEFLATQFKEYGPKNIRGKIKLDDKFINDY